MILSRVNQGLSFKFQNSIYITMCKFLFLKRIPAPLCNHHKSYHHLISTDQKIIYQFHTSLSVNLLPLFIFLSILFRKLCLYEFDNGKTNCKDRQKVGPPSQKKTLQEWRDQLIMEKTNLQLCNAVIVILILLL